MRPFLAFALILALSSGCTAFRQKPEVIIAPAGASGTETRAKAISDTQDSKVSAEVSAALFANKSNPDGNPKAAVEGALETAKAHLPEPKPEDAAAAMERVNQALRGDFEKASAGWRAAQSEATELRAQLKAANDAIEKERIDSANRLQAKIKEMQDEADKRVEAEKAKAEAELKRMIGYIFFGGAAISIAAGVAMLTFASSMPFVGGKVVLGAFVLAGVLASVGVALIRALNSPWIGRGMAIAGVVALGVVILAYANHWHHHEKNEPVK